MKSNEIGNINEALLVLKHFIDLSARLLPFLEELQNKNNPSYSEILNKKKIIAVYEGYEFDTTTSEVLLNSNILELIKSSFDQIINEKRLGRRPRCSKELKQFLKEHKRLKDDWFIAESN